MAIELHGRITEFGTLEVTLPKGIAPGDVTVWIKRSAPDVAWTDEEIQAIKDAAPKTFRELAAWLRTAPPTEPWGGLRDDEDAAEYIHNLRHAATAWPDTADASGAKPK